MERGTSYLRRDGLGPAETLAAIAQVARGIVAEQYRVFNESLAPALAEHGVRFLPRGDWNRAQARWARRFFRDEVLPVLTPIGLDPAHPFPRILNKSLNFVVELSGTDSFGRDAPLAVVQAPRSLARIIRIPAEVDATGPDDFVFLSSIIHAFVGELFPGLEVLGCHQFRVTRNTDLLVDDEEAEDLLRAVEGELASRRYGDEVRLEVAGADRRAVGPVSGDHLAQPGLQVGEPVIRVARPIGPLEGLEPEWVEEERGYPVSYHRAQYLRVDQQILPCVVKVGRGIDQADVVLDIAQVLGQDLASIPVARDRVWEKLTDRKVLVRDIDIEARSIRRVVNRPLVNRRKA
jgi:hypothetical protein